MIRIFNKFEQIPGNFVEVDTTSRGPFKGLSPFYLGPCVWEDKIFGVSRCQVFENMWQYLKVYPQHADRHGFLLPEYYTWRQQGFASQRVNRYPMGKGAKPLYSYFNGERLDYISARKKIYIPWYAQLVQQTQDFNKIKVWHLQGYNLAFRDFDGYDHDSMDMSLRDVVNNPRRPMGHAFVLKMILTGRLEECLNE